MFRHAMATLGWIRSVFGSDATTDEGMASAVHEALAAADRLGATLRRPNSADTRHDELPESAASSSTGDHDGDMASTPTVLGLLSGVPVFAHLPDRALEQVAAMAKDITHAEGHVVVREGTGAHALHVIVSGDAEVSIGGAEIAVLGPGDHFGEIALLSGGTRTATVTAASELRILAINAVSFLRLVRSDPELTASLPPAISTRLRELDEKRPS